MHNYPGTLVEPQTTMGPRNLLVPEKMLHTLKIPEHLGGKEPIDTGDRRSRKNTVQTDTQSHFLTGFPRLTEHQLYLNFKSKQSGCQGFWKKSNVKSNFVHNCAWLMQLQTFKSQASPALMCCADACVDFHSPCRSWWSLKAESGASGHLFGFWRHFTSHPEDCFGSTLSMSTLLRSFNKARRSGLMFTAHPCSAICVLLLSNSVWISLSVPHL